MHKKEVQKLKKTENLIFTWFIEHMHSFIAKALCKICSSALQWQVVLANLSLAHADASSKPRSVQVALSLYLLPPPCIKFRKWMKAYTCMHSYGMG